MIMTTDPESPEVLLRLYDEIEAATVVGALAEDDVKAFAVGGYTSGFKAEAPGAIDVMVRHVDIDRANRALAEIRDAEREIDWSSVDFGEPHEPDPDPN
jgi:hypothetical protein